MKVAFFNTGSRYDYAACRIRCMYCEGLLMHNIESIEYGATNLGDPFILKHTDGKTHAIILPCSIPLLSKLARRKGRSFFRKTIVALEKLVFTLQVIRRLSHDKVDVYVITHLWDYEIPFLNLILSTFKPTIIMWLGGSFRWYEQANRWKYCLFISIYRLSLRRAALTLISLDPEQEHYLFKVLKLPRNKVTSFKEYIVDDKLFRKLDKDKAAKEVGFNTNETNIIMVTRIETPERVTYSKDYEKDPFTTLEVFRHLVRKNPNLKLHVFGRGQGMEEFKKRIAKYTLQNKVKLYGYVDRERLPEYYAAADLSFFPFPFITVNDGQANHESLLCGTPVVFFKRYSWVKAEHQGGFAVDRDPQQAALQILTRLNPEYLNKKREEAATIPHDFNIETFGNSLARILKQVLY